VSETFVKAMANRKNDDEQAIERIIHRQFASLCWQEGGSGDWAQFASDFSPDALLYPAARPARAQTVDAFVERLSGMAGKSLHAFHETVLGTDISVFGNTAVALAACELTENETSISRGVEMLLLVKTAGEWKIVSQAWDMESPGQSIPAHLLNAD
jgi:ketosteroid isomerase-like protein